MPHPNPAIRVLLYGGAFAVACFLILPSAIVASVSFTDSLLLRFPPRGFSTRWYAEFFHDERWTSSALTSLKVAVIAMVLATVLGTLTAVGLSRQLSREGAHHFIRPYAPGRAADRYRRRDAACLQPMEPRRDAERLAIRN